MKVEVELTPWNKNPCSQELPLNLGIMYDFYPMLIQTKQ